MSVRNPIGFYSISNIYQDFSILDWGGPTVLDGVCIGEEAIVAAESIVTKDVMSLLSLVVFRLKC